MTPRLEWGTVPRVLTSRAQGSSTKVGRPSSAVWVPHKLYRIGDYCANLISDDQEGSRIQQGGVLQFRRSRSLLTCAFGGSYATVYFSSPGLDGAQNALSYWKLYLPIDTDQGWRSEAALKYPVYQS